MSAKEVLQHRHSQEEFFSQMVSNKITQEEGKIYLIIHTKTVTKQQIQWSSTNKTFHSSVLKSRVQSGLVSSA